MIETDGIKIVENIIGHKIRLSPVRWFREFNPERCCATCRFFRCSKSGKIWWCLRPNLEPFRVADKNPRGCLCDGWYAIPKDEVLE